MLRPHSTLSPAVLPWLIQRLLPVPLRKYLGRRFGGSYCPACGNDAITVRRPVLSSELIASWELSPEWVRRFEQREGLLCSVCRSSERVRHMATVIASECSRRLDLPPTSLAELVRTPAFQRLAVAELNPCGGLHQFLAQHPRLSYSDYGSSSVRSEDLQALTYDDETFDIVLTSDTLEHVPNIWLAFAELRRVLKPGGVHLFTVPMVSDRDTRWRATVENGRTRHLLAPSYHGAPGTRSDDRLVFVELGGDFPRLAADRGFPLEACTDPSNPALVTFAFRRSS
jgi:SAM-dependent methyltransferase